MTVFEDRRGNTLTATNGASVELFQQVLASWLAVRKDVPDLVDRLSDQDPEMPLVDIFRTHLVHAAANPATRGPIGPTMDRLRERAADLTAQERQHLAALEATIAGEREQALQIFEAILVDYPCDILALRLAHLGHFWTGIVENIRESVDRVLPAWESSDPFSGFVLGLHAYGLQETGHLDQGRRAAEQALAINPDDIFAAHANTHVFHGEGDVDGGVAFVEEVFGNFAAVGSYRNHLQWHKAVLLIRGGDLDAADAVYDEFVGRQIGEEFYLDACNSAALLWLLEIAGVDQTSRWERLRDETAHRLSDRELVFVSLHYLMPPARLGDPAALDALAGYRSWASENISQGRACAAAGERIARGLCELGAGNHAAAAELLDGALPDLSRIGGSMAQRELFSELAAHAKAMVSTHEL